MVEKITEILNPLLQILYGFPVHSLVIIVATIAFTAGLGMGMGVKAGLKALMTFIRAGLARGKDKMKKLAGKLRLGLGKSQESQNKNQAKEIDNDWSRWARSDPAKIQW
jgi:hypothetical protein